MENLEGLTLSGWLDYVGRTGATAMYPDVGTPEGMVYVGLGLVGEGGEVAEQLKKAIRDDHGSITPERSGKLGAEIGDVMWYLAQACVCVDLDATKVFKIALTAGGFIPTDVNKERAMLMSMRHFTHMGLEPDVETAGICLASLAWLCEFLGFGLDEVCENNLLKLASRKQRGQLHGSGDAR